MQKIGVFICWCGSNIAATVDVDAVTKAVKKEPGVVYSANYQYMCSEGGQSMIRAAIKDLDLTGIVVCSCSPRMHEGTFRKTAAAAGINPYMVEIANIREHCSWIHKDKAEGTEKAIILARAAIAKLNLNNPLKAGESSVTKRALVIGGGIAGAVEFIENVRQVYGGNADSVIGHLEEQLSALHPQRNLNFTARR
ncbi:MAG: disulfide reductase, partial [Clostridiales bacterium]|nr:disulfide reductase [Clostridiales bacterium]